MNIVVLRTNVVSFNAKHDNTLRLVKLTKPPFQCTSFTLQHPIGNTPYLEFVKFSEEENVVDNTKCRSERNIFALNLT